MERHELASCLGLELRRILTAPRIAFAVICLLICAALGAQELESMAYIVGTTVGASAQDVFYGLLSSETSVGIFLPLGMCVLCADVVTRDNESGMRDVMLVRLQHRRVWWTAKVLAVVCASLAYLLSAWVISCLYGKLVMGARVSTGEISSWLTYTGTRQALPGELYGGGLRLLPIPATWNVNVFDVILVVIYALAYAALALLLVALLMRCPQRSRPLEVAMAALVASHALVEAEDITMLVGITPGRGWIRLLEGVLSLKTYNLGGTLMGSTLDLYVSSTGELLSMEMNSMGVSLLLVGTVLLVAVLLGFWQMRRGGSCLAAGAAQRG